MGIFAYKTKIGFGVVLEHWTPHRSTKKLDTRNYPTYGLTETMTFEQADEQAKAYNQETKIKKRKEVQFTMDIQDKSYLNDKSLPEKLVSAFQEELEKEYKDNEERLDTILQHWTSAKKLLGKNKIDYTEFYDKRFDIFKYYEQKCWSADYIKRISKILNKWGSFCARKRGNFFEPIPKIGIRFNKIAEARENKTDIRRPATPLNWIDLKNLKTTFETEKLTEHWNWLFVGLFFGLRPSEIENLKKIKDKKTKEKFYKIEFDKTNKINVLFVYQNKLINLPENKRWKIIPIFEPEQTEALKIIESGEFKKPLNKTLKRLFKIEGIEAYSPRKGFTDLMLERKYQLEDISTFLGHSSIETTWRHYKNKFAYKLPDRQTPPAEALKLVSGENK